MSRPKRRNYAKIAAKRKATLIEKYGSWEAYREHHAAKSKAAMVARLGEEGYKAFQAEVGSRGGQLSKRQSPAKTTV